MDKPTSRAVTAGLPIGELSRRTGVNVETVRYYERAGLLPLPLRTSGGHRVYEHKHVLRLGFIHRGRDLGFTLKEVRALLDLAENRNRPCNEAQEVASAHLSDVRAKIAALRSMERVLAGMVKRCANGTNAGCPLIDALFESDPASGQPKSAA